MLTYVSTLRSAISRLLALFQIKLRLPTFRIIKVYMRLLNNLKLPLLIIRRSVVDRKTMANVTQIEQNDDSDDNPSSVTVIGLHCKLLPLP